MTREEAIEFIGQSIKDNVDMAKVADAISALEQEPYILDRRIDENTVIFKTLDGKEVEYIRKEPCEDAISRQAVIDKVNDALDEWDGGFNKFRANLVENAIRELPSVNAIQHTSNASKDVEQRTNALGDAVSREAVFNAIEREDKWLLAAKGHNGQTEIAFSGLKARVDALPSVTPSRCKGKWIEETKRECVFSIKGEDYECREYGNEIYLHCSNCGWKTGRQANDFNYCPSCGAKMVEPQESEEQTERRKYGSVN